MSSLVFFASVGRLEEYNVSSIKNYCRVTKAAICSTPGLGMTSSMIAAIETNHVSTEDHLARPPGWDALNYSHYDYIFQKLGYRIKRITTPWQPSYIQWATRSTPKWSGKPTETVIVKGDSFSIISRSSEMRRREARHPELRSFKNVEPPIERTTPWWQEPAIPRSSYRSSSSAYMDSSWSS